MNLPEKYRDRMKELLGNEYETYEQSLNKEHFSGIRVNTLKISPEEFEAIAPFEMKRVPWTSNGYYISTEEQPGKHPYYYAGLYYIQEPSAMTPAQLLPINPGDKVLDLCAAPGGKSTELAAKLKGEGLLVSNDISNTRAKALLKNIELFGIKNSIVTSEPPEKLAGYFGEYFDKILIDAPCSGEGMFRKDPTMIKNWEKVGTDYYSNLQRDIIICAAKMLKPGGMMLYSTCTFSPEENEGTIQHLLDLCPEFKVKQVETYEGFEHGRPEWVNGEEQLKNCIRLWPQKINGEGHFIALLQKEDGEVPQCSPHKMKKVTISDEMNEFFLKNLNQKYLTNLEMHECKVYQLPDSLPNLKGLRILRSGLLLGEMKKNRFEPSQAFANALSMAECSDTINLNSSQQETIKYLKGETIEIDGDTKNGWNLVCVDGYPLGWGKLTGTTLKNKYYPGWRWM